MLTTFGERLQVALDLRNRKLANVAYACNIDKSNLTKYMNGTYATPKQSTIEKIARYLDVAPAYLLGYQDNMTCFPVKLHQDLIGKSPENLQRDAIMNEINSLCSFASLETLKVLRVLVSTVCKGEGK